MHIIDTPIASGLKFKSKKIDSHSILIRISGSIDMYSVEHLNDFFKNLHSYNNIILDLDNVYFISSEGIGSIITLLKKVMIKNGLLVLCNLQPKIYENFEILGFNQLFIIKSLPDAILYVKEHNQLF